MQMVAIELLADKLTQSVAMVVIFVQVLFVLIVVASAVVGI